MPSLTDRLDALLHQWLERHGATRGPYRADADATGVVVVDRAAVEEVEAFCERWGMTVRRVSPTVLTVEGRALPVRGFTEIAAGYRR